MPSCALPHDGLCKSVVVSSSLPYYFLKLLKPTSNPMSQKMTVFRYVNMVIILMLKKSEAIMKHFAERDQSGLADGGGPRMSL